VRLLLTNKGVKCAYSWHMSLSLSVHDIQLQYVL
jgi:hypothetical protein